MVMADENVLSLAHAYAHATGILSGTMKILMEYGNTYSENEKIEMMRLALEDADKVIKDA
jgi:hypothetical protein